MKFGFALVVGGIRHIGVQISDAVSVGFALLGDGAFDVSEELAVALNVGREFKDLICLGVLDLHSFKNIYNGCAYHRPHLGVGVQYKSDWQNITESLRLKTEKFK